MQARGETPILSENDSNGSKGSVQIPKDWQSVAVWNDKIVSPRARRVQGRPRGRRRLGLQVRPEPNRGTLAHSDIPPSGGQPYAKVLGVGL